MIDHDEAWPESSSAAMFTFALITRVKQPAARRARIAVAGYIDQNENITNVCEGTGKLNNYDDYMARKRITGDFHGQAPVLWSVSALLR